MHLLQFFVQIITTHFIIYIITYFFSHQHNSLAGTSTNYRKTELDYYSFVTTDSRISAENKSRKRRLASKKRNKNYDSSI